MSHAIPDNRRVIPAAHLKLIAASTGHARIPCLRSRQLCGGHRIVDPLASLRNRVAKHRPYPETRLANQVRCSRRSHARYCRRDDLRLERRGEAGGVGHTHRDIRTIPIPCSGQSARKIWQRATIPNCQISAQHHVPEWHRRTITKLQTNVLPSKVPKNQGRAPLNHTKPAAVSPTARFGIARHLQQPALSYYAKSQSLSFVFR